jgi:hypothetical protein
MSSLRARFTPRHSTAVLLGGGMLVGVIGVALGTRLQPFPSAAAGHPSAAVEQNLAAPVATSPDADFDSTWRQLAALPASPARDEAQFAALRGWASVASDAAANWSLQRPLGERGADIDAVLEATARDPAVALRLAARLVRDDPELAHDHGCSLVYALAHRGDFADAAAFAAQGSSEHREAWLATAYSVWTEHQPQTAVAAALTLSNTTDREAATQAVVTRWATLDPHGLADFARGLPSEDARRTALGSALSEWANQDLAAASVWLNQLEPHPDFDAGVAAVATREPLVTYRPDTAVNWAESIFDPTIRIQTLTRIVNEWARVDRVAARHYVETSRAVGVGDRQSLLASLALPSEP